MAQKNKSTIMFYELCRLCLDERGHCNIFEGDGLSENIYRCIGVKVSFVYYLNLLNFTVAEEVYLWPWPLYNTSNRCWHALDSC